MPKTSALMRPVGISADLVAVVGPGPHTRASVTKKLWQYIKRHGLQDAKNRRNINADENLRVIFGKKTVNMFEMTKLVSKHIEG
jgi:chromatin remodeling complex protein RSC6